MKLLIEELATSGSLFQEITVGDDNIFLTNVRLHLYKHGHPPGGVTCEIQDTNGRTIKASAAVTVSAIDADITPTSSDFFHGLVRFTLDTPLKKNTNYRVALIAGGSYAFSEAAAPTTGYLGWCKDYDLRKIDTDYSPDTGFNSAFIHELWAKVIKRKGALK